MLHFLIRCSHQRKAPRLACRSALQPNESFKASPWVYQVHVSKKRTAQLLQSHHRAHCSTHKHQMRIRGPPLVHAKFPMPSQDQVPERLNPHPFQAGGVETLSSRLHLDESFAHSQQVLALKITSHLDWRKRSCAPESEVTRYTQLVGLHLSASSLCIRR